ncbi:Methionine aminopeptidase 2A [Phytophthora citrophthora]|uniref:Methionine aminopeptidase 2A n=1 Tax=Phytophthora citrophthora TaxID=4793 RepID=A0AAD9GT52_9STRA|nr:Methionine aminopeptidase 2A [Phytophthora citrophthora]
MAKHEKRKEQSSSTSLEATDHVQVVSNTSTVEATSKTKKQNQKRKKLKTSQAAGSKPPQFRGVEGFVDSYVAVGQTDPPTIPIENLFSGGHFPVGEIQNHPGDFNTFRFTNEEKRALDREQENTYESLRHAAEVHRHVRKFAQGMIKPGIKLIDLCTLLENKNRELVVEAGLDVRSGDFRCWLFKRIND